MNAMATVLDNPLFVKHLRSRLRRSQVMAPAVVVGSVCLCIAYAGYELNWYANGFAFGAFLSLQSIVLGVMGATQVSSSVGGARESGILDFHRVSPLSPTAVTLGFFFGAPVREYALAAMTVPFLLACAAMDAPGPWGVVQAEVVLLLGCWLLHALALLTSLSTKKPKAGAKGSVGVLIFLMIFAGPSGLMGMSRAASVIGESPTLDFFGVPLPWLAFVLLNGLPMLFFFLLASVRKMRSERAHAFTKPEAVACLATESALILGATWAVRDFPFLPLIVVYATSALACVLILTITPNLGEFTKGARRAAREGRARLGYWDDLALNRVAVFALCAIVLVAPTAAWYFIARGPFPPGIWPGFAGREVSFSITIAVAVLVVAYFGLAHQFFLLVAPRRGASMSALFIFMIWVMPPVLGGILGAARMDEDVALAVVATSPTAGLALSTEIGPKTGSTVLRGAALMPALVLALAFNNLVTWARRRALRHVAAGPDLAKPEPDPEFDP